MYFFVSLFIILVCVLQNSECTSCATSTLHAVCFRDGTLVSCFLIGTNATEIEETISKCSRESNYTELEINLQVPNTNFVLAMDLPESITFIEVAGVVENSSLQLTANRPHVSITEVEVINAVILLTEHTRDMFDIFPNVERIVCEGCTFSMLPSLIALSSLNSIEYSGTTQCDQGNLVHMDDLFVRGLEEITQIKWSGACVGSVSETDCIYNIPDSLKVVTIDLFVMLT